MSARFAFATRTVKSARGHWPKLQTQAHRVCVLALIGQLLKTKAAPPSGSPLLASGLHGEGEASSKGAQDGFCRRCLSNARPPPARAEAEAGDRCQTWLLGLADVLSCCAGWEREQFVDLAHRFCSALFHRNLFICSREKQACLAYVEGLDQVAHIFHPYPKLFYTYFPASSLVVWDAFWL